MWLKSGGIDLVVNDLRCQTFHPEAFTGLGIALSTQKMIVVKSSQHFYAGFAPLASEVIYVSSPGAINPDFTTIPYTKRKRDYWPAIEEPEL